MKQALFFKKLEAGKVQCELCPHNCLILPGGRGICGVRENRDGYLFSLVYDRVISSQVDPIEKKPLFHFLPGSLSYSIATVGCNFRCDFCQNYGISQGPREKKPIVGLETTPEKVVAAALAQGCRSIAYTYTEPTIFFEFAYDCAKLAKTRGLRNVFVTNGFINRAPLEMVAPYLDAANVDLKSFRDEYYRKICGGRLAPVLETLKLMKQLRIWVELTTLLVPGLNDSDQELTELAAFIKNELGEETPWHLSAFFPTYKLVDLPPTPETTLRRARDIGLAAGLKYVYTGNLPIAEAEDTFCPQCKEPLITRSGFSVLSNLIDGETACPKCGRPIAGVWR
ncbi:MAG: AmmeMemoRadiSam system radical SAM enzyme [Candidatus Margulisiibacteriota bacterium]|jgi:pyruvate formate lyase activating enzyme